MKVAVWIQHPRVACWNFSSRHAEALRHRVPAAEITICKHRAEFLETLPETEIALVWNFEQAWLSHAPRLRWIATPAAGRDYFNISPPASIRLSYGTFHGTIMAETALGMVLAILRGVAPAANLMRKEPWPQQKAVHGMRRVRDIQTTILGFGNIGQATGRLFSAVGADITGIRRTKMTRPHWFKATDRLSVPANLAQELTRTDVLILALPATAETETIINKAMIQQLPSSAVVVNIGRGNAIDEDALVDALNDRTIAAACLDVFQEEPLAEDHPLRRCDNAWLMPHISAVAPDYMLLFVEELIAGPVFRATDT